MLSVRYLKKNKRYTLSLVLSIILSSTLLFTIGILFSSFREFLIENTLKENDYHVRIKTDDNIIHDDIASINIYNEEYYIKYKNVKKTKVISDQICLKIECEKVVYNYKLLSLYGIGEDNYLDLFKTLVMFIVLILSISVFFIIYNSFSLSLSKKREDIMLLKLVGCSNAYLYKMLFLEGVLVGIMGIVLGFILSLFTNFAIVNLINRLFFEVLNGHLSVSVYYSFVLIPFIFMFVIVILSSLLPILKVKKYKPLELFRKENNYEIGKSFFKNFLLNYSFTNYVRSKRKYRGLILCIFISALLFYSFVRFTDYTTEIIDEYVRLPKYDVKIIMSDDKALEKLALKFKPTKELRYRYAFKSYDNYKVLVTDLGGNEIINLVDEVRVDDNLQKIKYRPYNDIRSIIIDGKEIAVKLTDNIPFGFEDELIEGRIILNLDSDLFDTVCQEYESAVILKTGASGISEIIENFSKDEGKEVSYVNVREAYMFINNFVLLIKVFTYLCVFISLLISLFTIFNITSASISYRKREFASLKAIGMTNFKISLSLLIESFIVCFKGFLYAFPFGLIISKILRENIGDYFYIDLGIFDYKLFFVSFIFCFLMMFLCTFFSHLSLYKKSLIWNIKN